MNLVISLILILSSLGIYGLYRTKPTKHVESDRIRTPKGTVGIILFVGASTITISLASLLGGWGYRFSNIVHWLGVGVMLGALLLGVSQKTLGENYTPCFRSFSSSDLTTTGVYRWMRHPIYSANMFFVFGCALASGAPLILLNVVLLWCVYQRNAKREEEALIRKHPAYAHYATHTSRFVPWLY